MCCQSRLTNRSQNTLKGLSKLALKNNVFEFYNKTLEQTVKKKNLIFRMSKLPPQNGVLSTELLFKPTDTHQFLDATYCHTYHCRKGIPFNQTRRLNKICSNNSNFDKRCNELESWLLKKW